MQNTVISCLQLNCHGGLNAAYSGHCENNTELTVGQ